MCLFSNATEQDVTQGQFLSGTLLVRIYNFPFNRPLFIPRLKSPVCSTIITIIPARGVIVIVVGNEHGDTSSNPGRD